MFARDCSTEESCEILLVKCKNEIFDRGLHFQHEFKMVVQNVRDNNWQDTATAKTKNKAQSIIITTISDRSTR